MSFKFRSLAFATAILSVGSVCSTAAFAEGRNWSGFYVGAHAGYGSADAKATDVLAPIGGFFTPVGNGFAFDFDSDSVVGGAQVGAQHQFGRWVLGAEVSYTAADFDKRIVSPYFPASDTERMSIGPIVTVTGKLGYAFDQWMLYAKGGYAGGDVEFKANDAISPASYTQSSWHNGYTVGAGLEYALSKQITLGVDYNYIDLGDKTESGTRTGIVGFERYKLESDIQTVGARINFYFGGDRHQAAPLK